MAPSSATINLQKLQSGDKKILREIFEAHYPMVVHTIYKMVPDRMLAEDLGQEVFIKLWEKRNQIQVNSNLGGYLRRMAINEAIAHLRKKSRFQAEEIEERHIKDHEPDVAQQLFGKELKTKIQMAIEALPPRCRTIFVLSRQEELSYREIAEKLSISIKTVENQMGKALKNLREALQGELYLYPATLLWLLEWIKNL